MHDEKFCIDKSMEKVIESQGGTVVRSLPDSICSDPAGSAARLVQRDGELSSS